MAVSDQGGSTTVGGSTIMGGSTPYSLIDSSNNVFDQVKKLWNSPIESHREVSVLQ